MTGRAAAALADPGTAVPTDASASDVPGATSAEPQTRGRGAAAGVDAHLHAVGRCDDDGVGAGPLVRRLGGAGVGRVLVGLLGQGRPVAPDPARAGAHPGGERPRGHAPVPGDPDQREPRGAQRAAGDGGAQPGRRGGAVGRGAAPGWPRAGPAPPRRGHGHGGRGQAEGVHRGADGVGLRGGGDGRSGTAPLPTAVRVRASPESGRSRRRRRADEEVVSCTRPAPCCRGKWASSHRKFTPVTCVTVFAQIRTKSVPAIHTSRDALSLRGKDEEGPSLEGRALLTRRVWTRTPGPGAHDRGTCAGPVLSRGLR